MRSEAVQERWNRVQHAVNLIKQLPGVRDAHIDDSNMDDTGFNVDVSYLLDGPRPPYSTNTVRFVFKDLRSIVQRINAILRKEGLRSNSIQQPKPVYDNFYHPRKCLGYDRTWGRFDVYCY